MACLQANSPKLQTRLQAFTDWYSKAVIALTLGAVAALRLCGVPLLGTATEVRRYPSLLVPTVSIVLDVCVHVLPLSQLVDVADILRGAAHLCRGIAPHILPFCQPVAIADISEVAAHLRNGADNGCPCHARELCMCLTRRAPCTGRWAC